MPSMKDGQLYHSLSRRELQKWCKRLGLPARKPSLVMAESLCSYFQEHDGQNSIPAKEYGGYLASSVPSEQSDTPLCSHDCTFADGSLLAPVDKNDSGKLNGMENATGLENGFLTSSEPEIVHQCAERNVTHKDSLSNGDPRSKRHMMCNNESRCISESHSQSTKGSVSFEFYAASEEGIKICIDLNSRPSDWIKKYKEELNMCENIHVNKARKLTVTRCATTREGGGGQNREHTYAGGLETREAIDNCANWSTNPALAIRKGVTNQSEGVEDSLTPSHSPSCLETFKCSHEARGFVSCFLDSGEKSELFCRNETPAEKTACNFKVKSSWTVEQHALKHRGEESEHPQLHCPIGNTSIGSYNCTTGKSMDMEISETGNSLGAVCHESGKITGLADSQFIALASTNTSDEQGYSNCENGRASSICSHGDESFEKTCSTGILAVKDKPHRAKWMATDINSESGSGRCEARRLRSAKHLTVTFPRRSTRLVSKFKADTCWIGNPHRGRELWRLRRKKNNMNREIFAKGNVLCFFCAKSKEQCIERKSQETAYYALLRVRFAPKQFGKLGSSV